MLQKELRNQYNNGYKNAQVCKKMGNELFGIRVF